jgi:hypothetical protein
VTESAPGDGWPRVSVIVATRDRPELLLRTVSSVLGQSYPGAVECAVVFDQDEPTALPEEVPSGRYVSALRNTRTPGLAGARNTGILATDAELVALCDDDDVWLPDKLTAQVGLLQRSAASFVACGVRIRHGDRAVDRVPPPKVVLEQLTRERVTALHPSTFLIRREALADIGPIDEELPGAYAEDYDLLLRAARLAPICAVPQPLVEVLWHEQSFFTERWQTIADALRYMLSKHPELRADRVGRARIDGQIAFAEAALGHRRDAFRSSWQALRGNLSERRAYLAIVVAAGVIPASSIIRAANRRGRGI